MDHSTAALRQTRLHFAPPGSRMASSLLTSALSFHPVSALPFSSPLFPLSRLWDHRLVGRQVERPPPRSSANQHVLHRVLILAT